MKLKIINTAKFIKENFYVIIFFLIILNPSISFLGIHKNKENIKNNSMLINKLKYNDSIKNIKIKRLEAEINSLKKN